MEENGSRKFTIKVNPLLGAYLTRGTLLKPSIIRKWEKTYGIKLKLEESSSYALLQYEVADSQGVRLE